MYPDWLELLEDAILAIYLPTFDEIWAYRRTFTFYDFFTTNKFNPFVPISDIFAHVMENVTDYDYTRPLDVNENTFWYKIF